MKPSVVAQPLKLPPDSAKAMQGAAAARHPPPNPPGSKPKPQKNVSLFDFLDLAKPKGAAAKGPILAARGGVGRTASVPRARVAPDASGGAPAGLGRTQRRGKEKEGPKKVRLSRMKKAILMELVQRHKGGSGEVVGGGGQMQIPGYAELEARAEARIAEEDRGMPPASGDARGGGAGGGDTGGGDTGGCDTGGEGAGVVDDEDAAGEGVAGGSATPGASEHGVVAGSIVVEGTGEAFASVGTAPLKRPAEAVGNACLIREYVDQIVAPCVNDAAKALLAEVQRFQVREGRRGRCVCVCKAYR